MAIQAWTGSGVVGLDVMGPQESPRQGQGDATWSQQTGRAGLVGGGALLGWLLVGLGLRRVSNTGLGPISDM